jgi:hypothetical protein
MKTLRLFTIAMLAVLVISTWAPFPAYAQPSVSSPDTLIGDLAAAKLAICVPFWSKKLQFLDIQKG